MNVILVLPAASQRLAHGSGHNGSGPAMLQARPLWIHCSWLRCRLVEEELHPNTPAADAEAGFGWVLCFHCHG